MPLCTGFIGTYSSPESLGVYRFTFDDQSGALTAPTLFYTAPNAKCVCIAANMLAAPAAQDEKAGLALLDPNTELIPPLAVNLPEHGTCCDIAMHDGRWYTANYSAGTVAVYEQRDTLSHIHLIENGTGAGCHQVQFHKNLLLVPCLELDEIRVFDIALDYAQIGAIPFPTGSGPRHLRFRRAHDLMYVVTERSHELFTYRVNNDFALCSRTSILDMPAANATTAALRLSPDERFIYVSTRGTDVLSVFACTTDGVSRVQQCSCGGKHPRDIVLSPCGRFLLVLNRVSNNLLAFPRDAQSGLLGAPVSEVTVHCGSGIAFLP